LKTSDQVTVLQDIAVFAAKVRGHALGNWRMVDGLATASCIRCGHEVTVCRSVTQPELDGAALASRCRHPVRTRAAQRTAIA